jgi:lipoyl(octanoyl) transferase
MAGQAVQAYLLGTVEFAAMMELQRRFVYQMSGRRDQAILVLCEHTPILTVGREGSRSHFDFDRAELAARRWPIRWVNRGGGCVLHLPGQLAIYSILSIQDWSRDVANYMGRLHRLLAKVLDDFSVEAVTRRDRAGLWVENRPIAQVGIAIQSWIAYFGATLNLDPDLTAYRHVRSPDRNEAPMTSLARERRGRVRTALVKERLLDHFACEFGGPRVSLFHDHPGLPQKARSDAYTARA